MESRRFRILKRFLFFFFPIFNPFYTRNISLTQFRSKYNIFYIQLDCGHFEIARDYFLHFEGTIDRGCVQVSSPASTAPFVRKKKGPSRFICRFNNRGSLCATLFEWLIRCLQPSGPTHNAARGNFATPSTFHLPWPPFSSYTTSSFLRPSTPFNLHSRSSLCTSFRRRGRPANFSLSLPLLNSIPSFRYFRVGHAIVFHLAASPPLSLDSPRKFSTRLDPRFHLFHFFVRRVIGNRGRKRGRIGGRDRREIIRECKRLYVR